MARHLRCNVKGGWYHITTRGVGRRRIFDDDLDRGHFLELLGELVVRYSLRVHAYVLMDNHYHLLIETPAGNASRALQWLNVSYSVWHNARHQECGQFFQGRYKSIPIQGNGAWALTCSIYLHLNPVRIRCLGLDKANRAAERAGAMPGPPVREVVLQRLAVLREYAWSSYPAYAGYARAPEWLTRETLWGRVAPTPKDAPAAYRHGIEDYLKQGVEEGTVSRLTQALALGSVSFVEKLRQHATGKSGAWTNARAWRRLLPFQQVAHAIETVYGIPWAKLVKRRGDAARDLALYVGRMHGGMTLAELGAKSGMRPATIGKAVHRIRQRLSKDRRLAQALVQVRQYVDPQQPET